MACSAQVSPRLIATIGLGLHCSPVGPCPVQYSSTQTKVLALIGRLPLQHTADSKTSSGAFTAPDGAIGAPATKVRPTAGACLRRGRRCNHHRSRCSRRRDRHRGGGGGSVYCARVGIVVRPGPGPLLPSTAVVLLWHCPGTALVLVPTALALPWHCPGTALALPWHCPSTRAHCPATARALPWYSYPVPWHCHGTCTTLGLPWRYPSTAP